MSLIVAFIFFFSSRRRHTRSYGDWSSDVCSSDLQHLAPEAEQLGRAPAGPDIELSGPFHEPAFFNQPAQVLLVQADAGQRLHESLQLQEREGGRQELEDNGAILQLAPNASQRRGQDAPVIERHLGGAGQRLQFAAILGSLQGEAPVSNGLRDETCRVKQFVTLKDALSGPGRTPQSEIDVRPLAPFPADCSFRGYPDPITESGRDGLLDNGGPSSAPVFPGEIAVRIFPVG